MKLRELQINPEADQEYTKGRGVENSATNITQTTNSNQEKIKELEARLQEAQEALAKVLTLHYVHEFSFFPFC